MRAKGNSDAITNSVLSSEKKGGGGGASFRFSHEAKVQAAVLRSFSRYDESAVSDTFCRRREAGTAAVGLISPCYGR